MKECTIDNVQLTIKDYENKLIKELTAARGISGDESEIRNVIKEHVTSFVDEIKVDTIGNLYAVKNGNSRKVMITAHMDEVGLMVTAVTDAGMVKIMPLGSSIDDRVAASKRVSIGKNRIPGVIGVKPVHMLEGDERKKPFKIKQLFVDIGCSNKEEAEKLVSLGDYVYYQSDSVDMGNGMLKAKALDNRAGCAVLTEVLKESYNCTVQGCFTVQEEIGLRGAGVAAYKLNPDLAIILEGTTCSDTPDTETHESICRIGKGPAVSFIDKHSYSNKELVKLVIETAKENGIMYQLREGIGGGNEAGKIQTSLEGIPTVMIAVPCRYIHSPSSVMCRQDFDDTVRLVKAVLRKLEAGY